MLLWRISNRSDLSGLGGEKSDGRWHTAARGKRIVYFAEHPAVALIEVLANLEGDPDLFPDTFQLIRAEAAKKVSVATLDPGVLPTDWRDRAAATQAIGNQWLVNGKSALLEVPSGPSPESMNYLFNPLHTDAAAVVIVWCKRLDYDRRLFRLR
jgi:RES domain-containing protein